MSFREHRCKASSFSFLYCELPRLVECTQCRNNTLTYNVRSTFCPEMLYPSKIGSCVPTARGLDAGLPVLITQPLHMRREPRFNSRRKRALCAFDQLCIRRFFYFKGKWREGEKRDENNKPAHAPYSNMIRRKWLIWVGHVAKRNDSSVPNQKWKSEGCLKPERRTNCQDMIDRMASKSTVPRMSLESCPEQNWMVMFISVLTVEIK